ncbi:MAG: pantoate--beta-alanine ligase [Phycisphaerales bacterium]
MGALHAGHLALVEYAVNQRQTMNAGPVVVTVFVNPTQFGPTEDFGKYPRTLEHDLALCDRAGADAVFAPSVVEIYPDGPESAYQPALPAVAREPQLEEAHRPTHFAGVLKVVHRLFTLVRPREAVFGEKDYQQLLAIVAMAKSEALGVEITGRPTVRDPDGLALSSRNVYLSPTQRNRALGLSRALQEAKRADTPEEAERAMRSLLLAHQVSIDYAVVRDAESLRPIESFDRDRPVRALIAGRVANTRLIDNAAIPVGSSRR